MNITDPIWQHAETYPDREAVYYDGRTLGFATFCRDVDKTAGHLSRAGIARGQRVAVASANPIMHLVTILALARIGAVSAPSSMDSPPEKRADMARACGITAFVRSHAEWRIEGIAEARHLLTNSLLGDAPSSGNFHAASGLGDQPWRIGLSSGTTGSPKAFSWTHEQSSRLTRQFAYPAGASERVLFFMGVSIMFGLHGLLRQLCAGGAVVIPKRLESEELLRCVERDRATQVITSTANAWALLQYVKSRAPGITECTQRLRYFVVGGSALTKTMRAELQERVCRNLFVTYGTSEGGNLARADPESMRLFPASAGYLLPWVEAQTVDDDGKVLPKGGHGRLRFRIPAVASGYENDPETTARAFRDGWYYPGDTGSVDAHGLLRLGARADDVINIGGVKIDPTMIEAVLNEDPAIRESVVTTASNKEGVSVLVGVVVARGPIDASALRATCRARLGAAYSPVSIVTVDRLPRNQEGKVLRGEVARMVRMKPAPAVNPGDANSAN